MVSLESRSASLSCFFARLNTSLPEASFNAKTSSETICTKVKNNALRPHPVAASPDEKAKLGSGRCPARYDLGNSKEWFV
jgi:hypothetical protein